MFAFQNLFLGINYWPAKKAMYWWKNFDKAEVERDFSVLAKNNLQLVRIFLTWEDFQPHPDLIAKTALEKLLWTADIAERFSLSLVPTFFCGHMSGINWLPYWMFDKNSASGRFLIYSQDALHTGIIKDFYGDEELVLAQCEQISAVSKMLKDHPAVHSFDLGNETSNLTIPQGRDQANHWLDRLTSALKQNTDTPVTLGMHAEDLEEDRHLWPQDAALFCDYLSMHAYPFYLSWVQDPFDHRLVSFLNIVTEWLGQKPVIMQEFGMPTIPQIDPLASVEYRQNIKSPLAEETTASLYYEKVMAMLYIERVSGAMAWCYADYSPDLWNLPPLDRNQHERHFGLFRHDLSPKKMVHVFKEYSWSEYTAASQNNRDWLKVFYRETFYQTPLDNLKKMFLVYQESLRSGDFQ